MADYTTTVKTSSQSISYMKNDIENGNDARIIEDGPRTTFLDLPAEIRYKIYEYAFDNVHISMRTFSVNIRPYNNEGFRIPGPTLRHTYRLFGPVRLRPYLLLTSKSIHDDAKDLFLRAIVIHYGPFCGRVYPSTSSTGIDLSGIRSQMRTNDGLLDDNGRRLSSDAIPTSQLHDNSAFSGGMLPADDAEDCWSRHVTCGSNIALMHTELAVIRKVYDNIHISTRLGFRNELARLFPALQLLTMHQPVSWIEIKNEAGRIQDSDLRARLDRSWMCLVNHADNSNYDDCESAEFDGESSDILARSLIGKTQHFITQVAMYMMATVTRSLRLQDKYQVSTIRKVVRAAQRHNDDDDDYVAERASKETGGNGRHEDYKNGYLLALSRADRGFAAHRTFDMKIFTVLSITRSQTRPLFGIVDDETGTDINFSEARYDGDVHHHHTNYNGIQHTSDNGVQHTSDNGVQHTSDNGVSSSSYNHDLGNSGESYNTGTGTDMTTTTTSLMPIMTTATSTPNPKQSFWSSWWDNLPRCEEHRHRHEERKKESAARQRKKAGYQSWSDWWSRLVKADNEVPEQRIEVIASVTYDWDTGEIVHFHVRPHKHGV